MNKILLFLGPTLFLLAELILPGGSANPEARITIIQNNVAAWEVGHQLIAVAFLFLLWWLGELYNFVRKGNGRMAYLGFLLSAFALVADYSIGILQLLTLDLVQAQPTDQTRAILTLIGASPNMLAFAFLPTLGFAVGFSLLAVGYQRSTGQKLPSVLLGLSGLLIALGGIVQLKAVFLLGALALLAFTVIFAKRDVVTAVASPDSVPQFEIG